MSDPLTPPPHDGAGPGPAASPASGCGILACGVVRIPVDDLGAFRKAPGPRPAGVDKVPLSLLKHADHQTLLALAAVFRAAQDAGLDGPFADWAVIAAPRFLGRIGTAGPFFKFRQLGASSVSPMIIPTMSLHAVAGTVSVALKAQGLNYGVGGGPGHLAEALLAGLAAREEPGTAGLWVVATGFDPEPIPGINGEVTGPSTGYGVALALTTRDTPGASAAPLHLRLDPTAAPVVVQGAASDAHGGEPLTPLIALADALAPTGAAAGPRRWRWPVPGLGVLAIEDAAGRGAARRAG